MEDLEKDQNRTDHSGVSHCKRWGDSEELYNTTKNNEEYPEPNRDSWHDK